MKHLTYLLFVFILLANSSKAQKMTIDEYFKINPTQINPKNNEIQEYDVTLKWQNLHPISGHKINCNAVKATYRVGLDNDSVEWENVSITQIVDFKQTLPKTTELPLFNGFKYKAKDTAFLSKNFYKDIPVDQQYLAKWLVSDAMQMQGLAWYVFDSLAFKKTFTPKLLENNDLKFEDWVTFTSRYQKIIWSGISKHNHEICAIVQFESYYNPLKIDNKQMQVKGRSLYYGEMWISLSDKQVEYASMLEDVIMKLKSPVFPEEQLINLQREVIFTKNDKN